MAVGPGEFGEHERVEAVVLAARGTEPGTHRSDLVGMDRDDAQAGVEQPLDQQPVGPLQRDASSINRLHNARMPRSSCR